MHPTSLERLGYDRRNENFKRKFAKIVRENDDSYSVEKKSWKTRQ